MQLPRRVAVSMRIILMVLDNETKWWCSGWKISVFPISVKWIIAIQLVTLDTNKTTTKTKVNFFVNKVRLC